MAHGTSRADGASAAPPPTIDTTPLEAGDADAEAPPRKLVKWNEFDWKYSTFRIGFGTLVDYAGFGQDAESKQQFAMDAGFKLRDFRLLFNGKFKTKRSVTWTLGYMYDAADSSWLFRQTGFQIGFPEAYGNLFIGRTKEGYSLIKVMAGYHPWVIERSPALDAFVPILADGVKWMGYFL